MMVCEACLCSEGVILWAIHMDSSKDQHQENPLCELFSTEGTVQQKDDLSDHFDHHISHHCL